MSTAKSNGKADVPVQKVADTPAPVAKVEEKPLQAEASNHLSSPPGKEYKAAFAPKEKGGAPDLTIEEGKKASPVKKDSLDVKKPPQELAKEGKIVDRSEPSQKAPSQDEGKGKDKPGKSEVTANPNDKAVSNDKPVESKTEVKQSSASGEKMPIGQAGDKNLTEKQNDKPETKPKISVELQNQDDPEKSEGAHFTVGENGDVVMAVDPEKSKDKNIKVVLERKAGQLNPTDAQKEAADELVRYLSGRLSQSEDGKPPEPVELKDKDNVVSQKTETETKVEPPQTQKNYSPETREQIGNLNRFKGSGGVDMPMTQSDGVGSFDTRQVPRQLNESDKQAALKEVVAGLFKPDEKAPYETIRKTADGVVHVGRYGLSAEQIEAFMAGLGDPPDPAKIEELVKQGKLPKDFAEKLKNPQFFNQMKDMVKQMQTGNVTPDALQQFLPKELQETIALDLVEKMKGKIGEAPGAVAAAVLSGKSAENVSPIDISTPGALEAAEAGDKLYQIATKRFENEAAARNPAGSDSGAAVVTDQDKRSLIVKALELARPGKPVTEAAISAVNTIIEKESSWNPKAINNWDSNAKAGIPSQGLMQTIPPTFKENALPGYDKDITDPLSNIIAGIRYSDKRYGGVETVVAKFKSGGQNKGY